MGAFIKYNVSFQQELVLYFASDLGSSNYLKETGFRQEFNVHPIAKEIQNSLNQVPNNSIKNQQTIEMETAVKVAN